MDIKRISAELSVSPQIAPSDVAAVAARGFRSIVCNRPDGEEGRQPAAAELRAAAEAQGLVFAYQPVVSGRMTEANVADFARAMAELPGPILAYCRSGTRCTVLWSLAEAPHQSADGILAAAGAAGYDLRGLRPQLEAAARAHRGSTAGSS